MAEIRRQWTYRDISTRSKPEASGQLPKAESLPKYIGIKQIQFFEGT